MFSDGCRLLASSEALELLWECCMKEEKKNLISCMQCAQGCREDFGGPGQNQTVGPLLAVGGHKHTLS